MKEVIRELYYGNIHPCESCNVKNSDVRALAKQIDEYRKILIKALPAEQQELLNKYDDLVGELSTVYYEEFFVDGFKLGAKFINEALNR